MVSDYPSSNSEQFMLVGRSDNDELWLFAAAAGFFFDALLFT